MFHERQSQESSETASMVISHEEKQPVQKRCAIL